MSRIRRGMPVEELAAVISEALTTAGITAVLSGGSVVSIYTVNEYESSDLDFVTAAAIKDLALLCEDLMRGPTGISSVIDTLERNISPGSRTPTPSPRP